MEGFAARKRERGSQNPGAGRQEPKIGKPFAFSLGRGDKPMLMTIAVLLIVLWLLGMVTTYTLSGFIHILLVLAIVAVLVRVIQGRSPV
jgi:hypothetical protein